MNRRDFMRGCAAGAASIIGGRAASAVDRDGEHLYNGIRLPSTWPPRHISLEQSPIAAPYLVDPPPMISIDVGRQLFVDDFLIEENTLERTYHSATYHPASPVLSPTMPWEKTDAYAELTHTPPSWAAMPYSDGVFYDAADRLFKMWYMGGYSRNVCYAVSHDGVLWERPLLERYPGTNVTLSVVRDSSTVWLDKFDEDQSARFKLATYNDRRMQLFTSRDGIHWVERGSTGAVGDRTTFFFNPFRKVWVFSIRDETADGRRFRRYWETPRFLHHTDWRRGEPVVWTGADDRDPRRPGENTPTQLYNLDCVAYESVLLGLFTIFRGEPRAREKPNDVIAGYSRDGFHWHRPDRHPFIAVSEHAGDWNWANVQSAGGCCLIVGDRLYFYVSGRRGIPGTSAPGACSTGLATLRRDGFASLSWPMPDARVRRIWPVISAGTVTTRPIQFSGSYLFVNADAHDGQIRAEVLDLRGRVVLPFSVANCSPVTSDSTRAPIRWGNESLGPLAGDAVRLRFHVTGAAKLYAFWVSRSPDGPSRGYLAAGGPGLRAPIDQ
jgi:hypothetical protein